MKFEVVIHKVFFYLLLLGPLAASAQDDSDKIPVPKTFQGRLIGGMDISQLVGDNYTGYHKVGLNAGGMVYVHYNPVFGTSLELLYSQKGVRGGNVSESYTVGTYFDKYYLNLNYAEAALMFHFDMFIFDYEAGMSYSRLIGSKEWAEADVPIVIDPVQSRFNSFDLDYNVGVSIRLGKGWYCNVRYQYSAIPIRPYGRVPTRYSDGSPEQYNENVCIRLEYALN